MANINMNECTIESSNPNVTIRYPSSAIAGSQLALAFGILAASNIPAGTEIAKVTAPKQIVYGSDTFAHQLGGGTNTAWFSLEAANGSVKTIFDLPASNKLYSLLFMVIVRP